MAVPLKTPLPLRLMPRGKTPPLRLHERAPTPPLALKAWMKGTPTVAIGRVAVAMLRVAFTVTYAGMLVMLPWVFVTSTV